MNDNVKDKRRTGKQKYNWKITSRDERIALCQTEQSKMTDRYFWRFKAANLHHGDGALLID